MSAIPWVEAERQFGELVINAHKVGIVVWLDYWNDEWLLCAKQKRYTVQRGGEIFSGQMKHLDVANLLCRVRRLEATLSVYEGFERICRCEVRDYGPEAVVEMRGIIETVDGNDRTSVFHRLAIADLVDEIEMT